MKIVLTGGGTAGHIMPNLALIPELSKHFEKIYYIGSNAMEKQILKGYKNIEFREISTVKLIRKFTLKNFLIPQKLLKSIKESKKILKEIKPDIIFSKGGYVSIPTAIAAKNLKIPVISHESDLSFGLANKIIYQFSNKMLTTFDCTAKNRKKCVCTGSPIREEIFKGNKNNLKLNFNNEKPNILIFGGSLGAKIINNLIFNNIADLCKKYNIVHIVGKGKKTVAKTPSNYFQIEFASNIQDYFDFADIVVTRGGSNSLFELLAIKKPMLIIPLSKAESRGDQIDNANYFEQKGYAKKLLQENLNYENFSKLINETLKEKNKIKSNMKENLANNNKKIVEIIINEIKK